LKGAYRLFNHPRVIPDAIQAEHRQHTLNRCGEHRVVLCVQDTTELDFTARTRTHGLGMIGNGRGRGIVQHGALAVTTDGDVLGVLDQRFLIRSESHGGEKRTALAERWRESNLWGEAMERIGHPPSNCRLIMVTDRAGDCFHAMHTCRTMDAGFLIRAVRDRHVEGHADKLDSWAKSLPVQCRTKVRVSRQAKPWGEVVKTARTAEVEVRFGAVTLDAPTRSAYSPLRVWVVSACEPNVPTAPKTERVEWLLLCSEPVEDQAAALRMLEWYSRRWVIEEWHRVLKEGCRIQESQLQEAAAIQNLAAVLGAVAAWMLQLRDLAGDAHNEGTSQADDPQALRRTVPSIWIQVVARHRCLEPSTLTPRQFWRAVAQQGGFLGRKGDGRPGWKTLWRGWHDYRQMVDYAALFRDPESCG
jgi:hypothetical protein